MILDALLGRRARQADAPPYSRVRYITEGTSWIIDRIGQDLVRYLNEDAGVKGEVAQSPAGLREQVIHFGSRHVYFGGAHRSVHASNRVIVTWFHGSAEDANPDNQRMIRMLPESLPCISRVVTASTVAKRRLMACGVPEVKLAMMPLGVDLRLFRPPAPDEREHHRRWLGVPEGAVCIGSFQKDGQGWGEGLQPKLIKGPDIFLQVIERLAKRLPVFVLLTGPARGYVKRGLEALGVPFRHDYVPSYEALAAYYHGLDLYLVTAREEGGPQALLEAMASGVPVVSTRVGMAEDVLVHGANGHLADVEDIDGLVAGAMAAADPAVLQRWTARGLETVRRYDWPGMLKQYYDLVYRPLLAAA